jgi:hypothetical protein
MPQLNYNYISDIRAEGMLYSAYPFAKRSVTNNTGAAIGAGRVIVAGDVMGEGILPDPMHQFVLGITLLKQAYEQPLGATEFVYPDKREMDLLTQGEISVFCETEVTSDDDPVFFRDEENGVGKDVLGRFRTDDDGGRCILLPNARWVKPSVSGNFPVLAINFI